MIRFAKRRPMAGLLAWLFGAMLVAQTLGQMHGIVHAPHSRIGQQQVLGVQQAGVPQAGDGVAAWLARLFAAHSDESTCRLYDQSSHGDCVPGVPAMPLPLQPAPLFLDVFEAQAPSPPAALVQARGPPSVR